MPDENHASTGKDDVEILKWTVERFASWVQFGDAKAGAVLLLLGLGLTDLLGKAGRLEHAHRLKSDWGDVATGSFILALALAAVVVLKGSRALFPRLKATTPSIFYFGSASEYASGPAYKADVVSLSRDAQTTHLAEQAWELARIAHQKFHRTRHAYWFAVAFLAAWSAARIAEALA
jgi:hypothetical protein